MLKKHIIHKLTALAITLSMCLSFLTSRALFAAAPTVGSTAPDAVKTAVTKLYALGAISGKPDGKFDEGSKLTRDQFTKMLVVALGLQNEATKTANGTTQFSDVAADKWSTGYINIAASKGIINGRPDGTFGPNDQVLYSEAITMVVRALGYKDVFLDGSWPANYLNKADELGLSKDTTTSVIASMNRGDAAVLLADTLDKNIISNTATAITAPTTTAPTTMLTKNKVYVVKDGILAAKRTNQDDKSSIITVLSKDDNSDRPTEKEYSISSDIDSDKLKIGTKGNFWVKREENKNIIIYIDIDKSNDGLKIIKHLSSIETNGDFYLLKGKAADNSDTSASISKNTYILINGSHVDDISKIGYDSTTKDYTYDTDITLIENTGDGIYDFAIVTQTPKSAATATPTPTTTTPPTPVTTAAPATAPTPTPAATTAPAPLPTATQTPVATTTPTPTQTTAPTPTPTSTAVPTPTPTAAPTPSNQLDSLSISGVQLNSNFSSSNYNYTADASSSVVDIVYSTTEKNSNVTTTLNGVIQDKNTGLILKTGENTLVVHVSAANDQSGNNYTVTISNPTVLLTVLSATYYSYNDNPDNPPMEQCALLDKQFSPGIYNYSAELDSGAMTLVLTPGDAKAHITLTKVNPDTSQEQAIDWATDISLDSDKTSFSISDLSLYNGENTYKIKVYISPNYVTTYTLVIKTVLPLG